MNKGKLRFYPVMILTLIICLAIASFTIATDINDGKSVPMNDGHYWSVYYLDACQQESSYVWTYFRALVFTSMEGKPGKKILTDNHGEQIGYWSLDIDVHEHHIIRIDLFDSVGASFIIAEKSDILEGNGQMTTECGSLRVFTKFLLVKK